MGNTRVMPNKLECNVFRGSLFYSVSLRICCSQLQRVTSPFNLNKSLSRVYARVNHDNSKIILLESKLKINNSEDILYDPSH